MIERIRKSRAARGLSVMLILTILVEIIQPSVSLALTEGPSQPEVQSFTPIGTSDMVDLSSGDFNYNIPLLDVGGYPINLAYNSGVTMDDEASWVGLGWNINPGAITRNMRGVPDDFNGDKISKEFNMKANITAGVSLGVGFEIAGWDGLNLNVGMSMNYNSYTGFFASQSIGAQIGFGSGLGLGLGLTSSSNEGVTINPSVSFSSAIDSKNNANNKVTGSVGLSWNSRQGLKDISVSGSTSSTEETKETLTDKNGVAIKDENGNDKKRHKRGDSGALGSSLTFSNSTYTPSISHAMANVSVSFSGKLGADAYLTDPTGHVSGYFSSQSLLSRSTSSNSYGYMYLNRGQSNSSAILDFNRDNEASYVKHTPVLPLVSVTYDLFNVNGQGVAAQFRPYQSSIGHVFDKRVSSGGGGAQIGIELGAGGLVKGGFAITTNFSKSSSGSWNDVTNRAQKKLKYAFETGSTDSEPVYFRNIGEFGVDEEWSRFEGTGGFNPVRIRLKMIGPDVIATAKYETANSQIIGIQGNYRRQQRVKRNQAIMNLNKSEVVEAGLQNYTSPHGKGYHIGEFTIYKPDGERYVYGLPAYNTTQKEVTFNVGDVTTPADGLVSYSEGVDNTTANKKGTDRYFQRQTTPAYAHSYLLTGVLSIDYQDYDNVRGPSEGDLGDYVLFDYDGDPNSLGVQPSISNYKWRVPYEQNKANYNEGLRTLRGDNKGSYVYGEKDVWYLQKIETKTQVAIFHLSDRHDGYEVIGENGGLNSTTGRSMLKLDKIVLYSKPDFDQHGQNATPIKTVHFEYTYELCGNTPNNDGFTEQVDGINVNLNKGKLTLKKLYFTYGNSERGKLSAYHFNYADNSPAQNHNYNLKEYNMWGGYKPYQTANGVTNAEYPYISPYESEQSLDIYASQWLLSSVELPSGGILNIVYESDDYAYVQNRRACHLLDIINMTSSDALNGVHSPGELINLFDGNTPNQFMWIRLLPEDENVNNPLTKDQFYKKYVEGLTNKDKLYFRVLADLKSSRSEYVSGYLERELPSTGGSNVYGVGIYNGKRYGYIKVKNVREENKNSGAHNAHPIAKASWQFVRSHLPQILQATNSLDDNLDEVGIIEAIASLGDLSGFLELFQGPNGYVRKKGFGNKLVAGNSWVRLTNPNGKKKGGGVRVRKITISDEWGGMTTSGETRSFGQEYIYETESGISSGVATYEPLVSKENPFVNPVYFDSKKTLIPNDQYMLEEPYGASLFPSPNVTYSRVATRDIYPVVNIEGTIYSTPDLRKTGEIVTEYYTSKDFPTVFRRTIVDTKPVESPKILQLFNLSVIDNQHVSQGYMIETNDMNGKLKSQRVYSQARNSDGSPVLISGLDHKYDLETVSISGFEKEQLKNKVLVVRKDGSVSEEMVGVEYELFNDFRQWKSTNISTGVDVNIGTFLASIIPIVVPTFFPSFVSEKTSIQMAVTTKLVNRMGVLREVVAYQDGARVSTRNVAWDAETGEVLLTQTTNEFGDKVYNMSFPAHWSYDRMGQAYKNLGVHIKTFSSSGNGIFTSSGASYFVEGDEVLVREGSGQYQKGWVLKASSSEVTLINKSGAVISITGSDITMKVVRSGRRNQQSLAVGSLTTKQNPIDETTGQLTDNLLSSSGNSIVTAAAMEYSDQWSVQKGVIGKCRHSITAHGELLVGYFQELINLKLIGDGSIFTSASSSVYPLVSSMANMYGLCNSCPETILENSSSDFKTLSLGVVCISDTTYCWGTCPHLLYGSDLNDTYNFSNIESIEYDPNATILSYPPPAKDVMPLRGYWSDGTSYPLLFMKMEYSAGCPGLGFIECIPPKNCGVNSGDVVNPFISNIRGVFRPFRSWVKLGARNQVNSESEVPDQRSQGDYTDFEYFWKKPVGADSDWEATPDSNNDGINDWTWGTTITPITGYNQNGIEQENTDALYRYSSAVYGYADKLPIAVAANATKAQIGYDGFEDYSFYSYNGCVNRHFAFDEYGPALTTNASHTGTMSLGIEGGGEIILTRQIASEPCVPTNLGFPVNQGQEYTVSDCERYNLFGPETYDRTSYEKSLANGQSPVLVARDQKYVLSYWVKNSNEYPSDADLNYVIGTINIDNTALSPISSRITKVIDGWQKIDLVYEIPGITPTGNSEHIINLSFKNYTGELMYIDDIRFQPYNSSMKTYVYDPVTLRLVAELDDQNFATFYEYDKEGKLLRVKKETERGIMTIKENRDHITNEGQ